MKPLNLQNNSIHKSFSSYRNIDNKNEQKTAMELAKKLQAKHIEEIKKSEEYKELQKEKLKQKQLEAEIEKHEEEKRKKQLEIIKNTTNEDIKKSVEIAKIQNEKFKNQLNQDSSTEDIFNTLLNDMKNY